MPTQVLSKFYMPTCLNITYVTYLPTRAEKKLDDKRPLFLLDVREPDEFTGWHIPSAINIPLGALQQRAQDVPKDKEIITICAHGIRSARASHFLHAQGYGVQTLDGGMVMWNCVYDIVPVPCSLENGEVLQFRRIGKGCLSYMIFSGDKSINAAVIDPTVDIQLYIEEAEKRKAHIVGVLETHMQADHVSGARELAGAVQGLHMFGREGTFQIGDAEIRAVSGPGHTQESVVCILGNLAFTGDTLFIESVGRPDLGENMRAQAAQLWETLQKKLLALPETTIILPAHYGAAVELRKNVPVAAPLGELKKKLHALQLGKEEFITFITKNIPQKPPHFEAIMQVNKGLAEGDLSEIRELEAGPNRCAVK